MPGSASADIIALIPLKNTWTLSYVQSAVIAYRVCTTKLHCHTAALQEGNVLIQGSVQRSVAPAERIALLDHRNQLSAPKIPTAQPTQANRYCVMLESAHSMECARRKVLLLQPLAQSLGAILLRPLLLASSVLTILLLAVD